MRIIIKIFDKVIFLSLTLSCVTVINLYSFYLPYNYIKTPSQQTERPFSNPILFYGSSFGNFFQTLFKQGKFEEMIVFTSKDSINKYGIKNILETYKNMQFGYDIKLKSSNSNPNKTITLNYETEIMATKGIMRMNVVVENDTVKVLLNKINNKNPF